MKKYITAIIITLAFVSIFAQRKYQYNVGEFYKPHPPKMTGQFGENYDPTKADIYKKLDILQLPDGAKIKTARQWELLKRDVLKFVENDIFTPQIPRPKTLQFKLLERDENALESTAIRMQYEIISGDNLGEHSFTLLIYTPKGKMGTPVFVNANFTGNHTVIDEPKVIMPKGFLLNNRKVKIKDGKAHDYQRGLAHSRHQIREIINSGFAVATFCYHELYADKYSTQESGEAESIYKIFDKQTHNAPRKAMAAWAYGKMRALDCLETIPEIDASNAYAVGHSRLGKAALYAAVLDKRFAGVFSNSSCILGAKMIRRNFGVPLKKVVELTKHWYSPKLTEHANDIEKMPFDQQHFLACMAPRPVYVASAAEDYWCDPIGEFLSLYEASKIYKLYGAKNLPNKSDMKVATPFHGDVGHHIRFGDHDITLYDRQQYIAFLKKRGL